MEKFSLKWNDFSSNVQKSYQNLRQEEDFFDVTLVGDDFKHVTAHKLVLSSSSEYFKKIFSRNKKYYQSHALICLEGLNQNDLNNVLDYIYHGEIQIFQHDLDRFLGIAERLKLEGLIGGQQHKKEDYIKAEFLPEAEDVSISPKDEYKITRGHDNRVTEKPVISFQSPEIHSMEELEKKVEESYSKAPHNFTCNYCGKVFRLRGHIKEHVEIHFEGLSWPCSLCDTVLRTRSTLRFHTKKKHLS